MLYFHANDYAGISSVCRTQEGTVTDIKVRRIVSSIWGNKVVKTKSSSLTVSDYRNLQVLQVKLKDKEEIVGFDETTVDDIRVLGRIFQN